MAVWRDDYREPDAIRIKRMPKKAIQMKRATYRGSPHEMENAEEWWQRGRFLEDESSFGEDYFGVWRKFFYTTRRKNDHEDVAMLEADPTGTAEQTSRSARDLMIIKYTSRGAR
jgi:hypothetical protein